MISNFTRAWPLCGTNSRGNRVMAIKPFLTLIPIRDIYLCSVGWLTLCLNALQSYRYSTIFCYLLPKKLQHKFIQVMF